MKICREGIYRISIELSETLMSEKEEIEELFAKAQERLVKFARTYSWEKHTKDRFIEKALIYDEYSDFIEAVYNLVDVPVNFKFPKSFSACLENGIFLSVSPRLYKEIYPPQANDNSAFEKLIVHEMAHRLHVRILKGKEDLMGPTWFFEGFALFVAEQFKDFNLSSCEVWNLIEQPEKTSYKHYAAVFRYFLARNSINELIINAGKDSFYDWLHSQQ